MFSAAQTIAQDIIFITPDQREAENIAFLERQGFNVIPFWLPNRISTAGQDTIDMLNAADLVIIGRSGPSSNFQQDADRIAWNAITAPVMLICQWKARSSRLRWFNSTDSYHEDQAPPIAYGKVADPTDPIFANANVAADSTIDWFSPPPHDFIRIRPTTTTTNAEIVATYNDSSILIARFAPNVRFYPETPDSAAGPRTYMGIGNDNLGWPNFFPFTKNAKAVYLAEICRMMGIPVQEPVFAPIDYDIVFASPDERDSTYINILTAEGYNVTKWYATALSTEPVETIDMLNRSDLIIIGRSPASSNFTGANKYAWNKKIQVPVILTTQWAARNTRINWFESGNCVHYDADPDTVVAKILDPSDPVFADVTIDADSMIAWSTAPEDAILVDSAINGTVLATYDTNAILFARFDPCVEFYPGAGPTEKAAAPRTFFGMGNDNVGWPHFFTLTDEAKPILLAEVARLVALDYTVCTDYPSDDVTLASLTVDVGELVPAFDPAVTEYKVIVPQGTDSVLVSAVANDAGASVAGTGKVGVAGGITTKAITVTAADTYTKLTYNVTLQTAIVIDGAIGAGEWDRAEAMPVEKEIDVPNIADENDYSLYFKMLWSDAALYLLLDVTDDAVFLGHVNVYQDDNIEIYFDMNNSKIQKWPRSKGWSTRPWTQMDDNDMQLRIQPTVADVLYESNLFGTTVPNTVVNGIVLAQTSSATGYIFEMMFDFDSLAVGYPEFVAAEGTEIGFDIDASDNDDNPSYRDQLGWNTDNELIYTDACLWGTLRFNADGTVTRILDTEAPTAPTNLAASVVGTKVTLTWDASTDNIIVNEYFIYVAGVQMGTVMAKETGNGGTLSVSVPAGTYPVGISAVDPSGNESAQSIINITITGIDEKTVSYSIYPVPASDMLIVENAGLIERIEVFDMVGQSVMDVVVNAPCVKLNTSGLKSGVYIMKLHTAGEVFTEQIVIE
jgi:hypothetical protein